MPNHRCQPRPRRHSLSSGDESVHPHPAKADDLPRPDSRRRARLPRSKSTSNVSDALSRARRATECNTSNVALEHVDITTARELVNVLRTTGPPPNRPSIHDDCFRISGTGESSRWSLQSLRRSKRIRSQRNSLQSHLPENVIPGTTADGYRYNAISTPVLMNNADGPWFRSQYPIFLPSPQSPQSPPSHRPSSTRTWPERNSSKAVHFLSAEKETEDIGFSSHRRTRTNDNDHSRLNRVSTDHLLRAMLKPVDEGYEHDLGPSWGMLCPRKDPEDGTIQSLPLVTVDEKETNWLDDSKLAAPTEIALDTKTLLNEISRKSTPTSPEGKGSPHPPSRTSRRVANIQVQPGLAVPKEDLVPESPGFPNMLATMTFPSPPKGSRPSSPVSPGSTAPSIARNLSSRPMVQARTSSRRAATSMSVSSTSLDELVMRRRPSSSHVKSAESMVRSDTVAIDGTSAVRPPTGPADYPTSSTNNLSKASQSEPSFLFSFQS